MRRQDWALVITIVMPVLGLLAFSLGHPVPAAASAGVGLSALLISHRWARMYPGPMDHGIRWVLYLPRPFYSLRHTLRMLAPQPGERILEVGPGIGRYALPLAPQLAPGRLDVLDTQSAMLDEVRSRARELGVDNLDATQGDAMRLPYADASFDGAYLITVLGEVPQPLAALKELARVLKPAGRLVIGECVVDPDFVSLPRLHELAAQAGLVVDRETGVRFSYLARLRHPQVT